MLNSHSNTKETTFLNTSKFCGGRSEVDVSFGEREITESLTSIQEVLGLIPSWTSGIFAVDFSLSLQSLCLLIQLSNVPGGRLL